MGTIASQITASPLLTQPFIRVQIKENIIAPRHWPLCRKSLGTGEFPAQTASNAENVSIWWRHHESHFRLPNVFHVIYSKIYTFNNSHETRNFTTMIKIQHKILPFVHKWLTQNFNGALLCQICIVMKFSLKFAVVEKYQQGGINTILPGHDDVIKWKHFPRYWPCVRGIHRSPVNSPHEGQWHGAFMFSVRNTSELTWL